jgi:choline dehydrogenase-like flavoprotein
MAKRDADVIVVGSGAGGAVTALELAQAGVDVLVLEEGLRHGLEDYGAPAPRAMRRLYRRGGMTPIVGRVPIGYVEGACVGGSTEINSGFWHRAPREVLVRWRTQYELEAASEEELLPHFEWAEQRLGVTLSQAPWPSSTRLFARGVERMGWSYVEVPRAAPGCQQTNACAQGCPTGAKAGMSRSVLPAAEAAGARLFTGTRVLQLLRKKKRVIGVVARRQHRDGTAQLIRLEADHVFVCAGPTETPALLLRSGIKYHVGNTLRVHPYLKVIARFDEVVDAHRQVLPLLQVKEFGPDLSLGGAFFSLGQLAMTLSENWPQNRELMRYHRHMAHYYVGVRGTGQGWVRPSLFGTDATFVRYELSDADAKHLSVGLAHLAALLIAGGAKEVYPSVAGLPVIRSEAEAARWLDEVLPKSRLGLVTVHAFSSCPAGERRDLCAADSFGRVFGAEGLSVNDASMLPDSPGVNPQGTIMALARRNALAFVADRNRSKWDAKVTPITVSA